MKRFLTLPCGWWGGEISVVLSKVRRFICPCHPMVGAKEGGRAKAVLTILDRLVDADGASFETKI